MEPGARGGYLRVLNHAGPCPWTACKYNLYLDVDPETGFIKLNFPDKQPDELEETCALRVARKAKEQRRQTPMAVVAKLMNLTDERLRQIEHLSLAKLKDAVDPATEDEVMG